MLLLLISSKSFVLLLILDFLHRQCKKRQFYFFLSPYMYALFSCLVALSRTSTMTIYFVFEKTLFWEDIGGFIRFSVVLGKHIHRHIVKNYHSKKKENTARDRITCLFQDPSQQDGRYNFSLKLNFLVRATD